MNQNNSGKKLTCSECKKKLGLIGIKCRCDKMYCTAHIMAETHNCSYDYRGEAMKTLSTTMIAVTHDRVDGRI